ncbi:hypothetical protein ACOWOA_00580 [Helicobacter pylori]
MLIVAEAVSALNKKVVAAKKNKIRFTPNSYIHNRNKNRRYSSLSPLLNLLLFFYKNHLEFKLF